MVYKISKEYTETPGGRYINGGKYSGEDFRNNHLIPLIERCKEQEETLNIISFISNEEPELIDTILTYIKEENDRIHKRKLTMWYNNI